MGTAKKRGTNKKLLKIKSPPLAPDLPTTREIFAMRWTEYERGWGCRPDGYSLHNTFNGAVKYARDFLNDRSAAVPDEYTQPDGPLGREVYVWSCDVPCEAPVLQALLQKKNSVLRIFRSFGDTPIGREYAQARAVLNFADNRRRTVDPFAYQPA